MGGTRAGGAFHLSDDHPQLGCYSACDELAPETPDDVTRAVTAAGLLRDRLLVLTRLRHGGAHVIEAAHDQVGERLVEGYVDLKRRNLL